MMAPFHRDMPLAHMTQRFDALTSLSISSACVNLKMPYTERHDYHMYREQWAQAFFHQLFDIVTGPRCSQTDNS